MNAATLDRAAQILADHPDGITVRQLREALGTGPSTADRCLRELRDLGRARLVGKRGQALLYAAALRAV